MKILLVRAIYFFDYDTGLHSIQELYYNTVTRKVEENGYQDSSAPDTYSRPSTETIDSYLFGGQLRRVFHQGNGLIGFRDAVPVSASFQINPVLCFGSNTGYIYYPAQRRRWHLWLSMVLRTTNQRHSKPNGRHLFRAGVRPGRCEQPF